MVLLHGQPGSGADWVGVARLLEPSRTVIVPDRPGYGLTGGRARGFRGNAAAVCALLDRLGLHDAVIVGHSWSGGVALAMAEDFADRVAGLVLVASVGPGEALSPIDRALAVPRIGAAVAAITFGVAGRAVTRSPIRRLLERRLHASEDDGLVAMADAWRSGDVWRSFVIEQQALIEELPTLERGLAGIHVPTRVVVGEADHIVPPATGAHLAARIPGATLVSVAGAGHLLPQERPTDIATAVLDLYRR